MVQSFYVGFAVNALLVDSIANWRCSDNKSINLLRCTGQFLCVAVFAGKRFDSRRCGVSGFVAAGLMGSFPSLFCTVCSAAAANCRCFGQVGLSRVPAR